MKTPDRKRFKTREEHPYKPAPLKGKLVLSSKEMRLNLGLTQTDFWAPVGVSQSGGSRYESGRKLPLSTSVLLELVHIQGIDIGALDGDSVRVGSYLRAVDRAQFEKLLAAAKEHPSAACA